MKGHEERKRAKVIVCPRMLLSEWEWGCSAIGDRGTTLGALPLFLANGMAETTLGTWRKTASTANNLHRTSIIH